MSDKITYEKVRELYDYRNGKLYWRKSGSGRTKLDVGCINHHGYIVTAYKKKQQQVHRLIFLWHHGYMPENEIDHINRDRSDNRIENLREVSVSCNQRNRGNPTNNTSGVKGILFDKREHLWRASISFSGKLNQLGYFKYKYEAVLMRLAAEQCLGWDGCDSSSPAYKYARKYGLIKR